jgi:hypothetical protein
MTVHLSPVFGAGAQLFDNQGRVLAGGFIYTYLANSTTPQATFTDNTGNTANALAVPLDSAGRPPQEIWLTEGIAYKFIVTTSALVPVGIAYDNIFGVNDPTGTGFSVSEWVASGLTPSYISSTQFSVTGNQTSLFSVGERVKYVVTAGTGYGTVTASVFSSVTTVTVSADSTALDNGLSTVSYAFISALHPSVDIAGVAYRPAVPEPTGSAGVPVAKADRALTPILTTGSSVAYVLTPSSPLTAYAGSNPFLINFHTASGATPTINVSGLGAIPLRRRNEVASTYVDPAVVSTRAYWCVYDSASGDMLALDTTVDGFGGAVSLSALASFVKSAAANGYQTLPGGIILQWASGSGVTAEGQQTIAFPLAFPTAVFQIIAGCKYPTGDSNTNATFQWVSNTLSGVVVMCQNDAASWASPVTPVIFAVGN